MKLIKQEGSRTFLLKVNDNDEYGTASEFAIVTIDDKLLNQIKEFKNTLLQLKEKGLSPYRLTSFSYAVDYLSNGQEEETRSIPEELEENIWELFEDDNEHNEFVRIAPVEIEDTPTIRQECGQLIVDDYGIIFDAYVKFTNTRMYTAKISHEQLGL